MSATSTLDMSAVVPESAHGYPLTAWARGHDVLLYEQYGSYQGEWLLFARDPRMGEYFVYKGGYGSCSGCDSWQGSSLETRLSDRQWNDDYTGSIPPKPITRGDPDVQAWAKDYPPFIEIPRETARALAQNGTLGTVFPMNVRDEYGSEVDLPRFVVDATTLIKLHESLPFAVDDVWATTNQELRRRAREAYGVERFVRDAGMVAIDRDGDDALVSVPSRRETYLHLKDASTPRRYLLRVPPEMQRVRQAKAWTFGLGESEYRPLVET